jgi:hypothetical protein
VLHLRPTCKLGHAVAVPNQPKIQRPPPSVSLNSANTYLSCLASEPDRGPEWSMNKTGDTSPPLIVQARGRIKGYLSPDAWHPISGSQAWKPSELGVLKNVECLPHEPCTASPCNLKPYSMLSCCVGAFCVSSISQFFNCALTYIKKKKSVRVTNAHSAPHVHILINALGQNPCNL